MEKQHRNRALIIKPLSNIAPFALLLALLTPASWAHCGADVDSAEKSEKPVVTTELQPYQAHYRSNKWGMSIKLTRTLSREQNTYQLSENGKAMMQKIRQSSVFSTEGASLIPDQFHYKLSGIVKRKREVQFPSDDAPVRSLYKDKWYEFPRKESMLDRLSQQEQVRLWLLNGASPTEGFLLNVVDGKKAKDYQLVYAGNETLQTALGPVETVHFNRLHKDNSRSTDIWMAPKWDYLIVRTVHVEDGDPVEAVIIDGSIDGKPLGKIGI